ncbi:hypothetical protein TCAL_14459 [Tigriopus californicus]|uniref:Uncharacterized protein n=1 Tax=Tigriopus californicus TaxID=6832 RepID=A0A553PTV7_TIGCA|nr:hypothetical protein TCAL_14459 [Tigriopus californicus]
MLGPHDATSTAFKPIQVSLNNMARTITGLERTDHVLVCDLQDCARLPYLYKLVVRADAMEAWKVFHNSDSGSGEQNPIGTTMFGPVGTGISQDRSLRSNLAGQVIIPLRGVNAIVCHAATIWNQWPELQAAKSSGAAKLAARTFARTKK